MKPKVLVVVTLFALTLALLGCDRESAMRAEQLQSENAELRKELEEAKRERDELKFGSSRLLAQLELAAAKLDWPAAKTQAEELIDRHPASPEAEKARQLLAVATSAMAKAAKEAEAAESRRAEAEKQKKLQEERRLDVALKRMHKKVDSIESVTWYRDQSSPRYANYNGFFLYIGKREQAAPFLRLRIQYNADDWLFIESFLVVADGQRFDYSLVDFERDNSSEIWEWYDEPATSKDLEMVRAVISSKNAVIRFNGRQYRRDRTITASEKAALQNVLDAYKVLGGN